MADNSTLPATGDIVEDLDTFGVSGVHSKRQVMTISPRDLSAADSIGALTETAPASDTASSGLNGRLQRIAQRITSMIALLPTALGAGGGLKVEPSGSALIIQGLQSANTAGSITTSSSVVGPLTVTGFNVVTVAIFGTYAGVTCIFEASPDNTNWFTVQGSRVDNGLLATGLTTATNTTIAVDVPIGAFSQFRVRATAYTSGTASVIFAAQTLPYDPCPATVPQQTTGTNLHTVVDSGTITTVSTVTAVTGITNALPAGTNLLGKTGIDQTTPATTNGVVPNSTSAAGGISSTARLASAAASTNATNVKTTAGRIYSLQGKNNAAYDVFLVLYDAATNPPVPGTTTIRKKIVCPAGQAFTYDWGALGLSFATGIGYAFTKVVADADTTILVAADITAFNMDYV